MVYILIIFASMHYIFLVYYYRSEILNIQHHNVLVLLITYLLAAKSLHTDPDAKSGLQCVHMLCMTKKMHFLIAQKKFRLILRVNLREWDVLIYI